MPTSKPEFVKRNLLAVGPEYATLLGELKDRFRRSQIKAAVRVNTSMLEFYWAMGREISRLYKSAKYGSAFFDCLSLDLRAEFPGQTGFSAANIRYTYRWYEFYNQDDANLHQVGEESIPESKLENLQQLAEESILQSKEEVEMPADFGEIPWKHHVAIFTKSKSVSEALFYIEKTIQNCWSRAQLEAEIESNLYTRQGHAITNFQAKLPAPFSGLAQDILKSSYDLSFVDKRITCERELEDELSSNITRFLLELGQGFAYVGRQMELRMPGGQTFIPDMIFYHTRLKAYIVVELKVKPFIPEYVGKLNFYVSAVDELMRQDDDNPTIGLLICKSKDDTVVEWSFRGMSQPLGVAEYHPLAERLAKMLPTETQLQQLIDTYII